MPSLLLHFAVVERLAKEVTQLPPEVARALADDLEYARLGAALSDLPDYGVLPTGAKLLGKRMQRSGLARELHQRAPINLGLKMAELVALGGLVGREPGLAFLAGYFTHVCVDRALSPLENELAHRFRQAQEHVEVARRRVESVQALLFMRDEFGRDLVGQGALRSKMQVLKRAGPPTRGVGRGFYEVIRLGVQDTLAKELPKRQLDGWINGLYVEALLWSSALRRLARPRIEPVDERALYLDPDVPGVIDHALGIARHMLTRLCRLMGHGHLTARKRERFLEEFPEGPLDAQAA